MTLTELSKEIHRNAVEHGFYDDNPSERHLVCLIICELAEAVEADRNDRHAQREAYEVLMEITDETNEKDLAIFWFEDYIKDTVEDEIADVVIRILDFAAHLRCDLELSNFNSRIIPPDRDATFTEYIFRVIKALANFEPTGIRLRGLCYAYHLLLNIADLIGMDLEWHVMEKMKYNQSRPKRHGKKY